MIKNMIDREATKAANFVSKKSWISNAGAHHLFALDKTIRRQQILSRDNYTCQKCGRKNLIWEGDTPHSAEWDHIHGRGKTHGDEMSNGQTLCRHCHVRKTGRMIGGRKP